MREKCKKIIIGYLPGFITGIIICGVVSVIAATYFPSNQTTYDNSVSGLQSTNVQGAIDELYGVCTAKPPGEQIIEDNGLEKDPYECRYFFTGANPNNYVTFNNEEAGWRIISVGCDGTIKIMRTLSIENMVWDSSSSNNWARPASLNTYLNGTYLNSLSSEAQSQIVAYDFSIGAIDINNDLPGQVNDENSTTWNGKVGLATATEYLRSNSNTSNCSTVALVNQNYTTCKNTTWMFNSETWWTMSASAYLANVAFLVNSGGNIYGGIGVYVFDSYGVRPVVYLSSEVKIIGGDGSQSNPYTIE